MAETLKSALFAGEVMTIVGGILTGGVSTKALLTVIETAPEVVDAPELSYALIVIA